MNLHLNLKVTLIIFFFLHFLSLKNHKTEFMHHILSVSSESGLAGVAFLHKPPRRASGWAAKGPRGPDSVPLPHAVRRVRQGLPAPQQLHGLRPEGKRRHLGHHQDGRLFLYNHLIHCLLFFFSCWMPWNCPRARFCSSCWQESCAGTESTSWRSSSRPASKGSPSGQ